MQRRGLPFLEAISKKVKKPMSLQEVKAWRTREAEAGRPSSYADYCRAYGVCVTCLGEGVTHNDNGVGFKVVGMDGNTQLFEQCPVCGHRYAPNVLASFGRVGPSFLDFDCITPTEDAPPFALFKGWETTTLAAPTAALGYPLTNVK